MWTSIYTCLTHAQMHYARTVNGFGTREWFYVMLGVVLVGLFCMRGFGSRKNY